MYTGGNKQMEAGEILTGKHDKKHKRNPTEGVESSQLRGIRGKLVRSEGGTVALERQIPAQI